MFGTNSLLVKTVAFLVVVHTLTHELHLLMVGNNMVGAAPLGGGEQDG